MEELWRPIPGYETTYEVSNFGRIKRIGFIKSKQVNRIAKPFIGTHGYVIINLSEKNVKRKHSVHRLVLSAFDKPMPRNFDARHKDGTRTNNHIDNLQWGTRSDNMRDAIAHGRTNRGIKNPCAKLTEAQVVSIRKDERTQTVIARAYGVGQDVISRIKSRKAWYWVE